MNMPLRRADRNRIQVNRAFLEENLDPSYFVAYFVEKDILNSCDREEIESIVRSNLRCAKFLHLFMVKGGKDGYTIFVDHLRSEGIYDHIVEKLESTQGIDPWAWYDRIDETTKQHPINDADASRISRCLGSGWEALLMELGIRQNEIDIERDNNRSSITNICNLLIKWWHRKSREATVNALVEKMKALDDVLVLSVDTEKLQGAIQKIGR